MAADLNVSKLTRAADQLRSQIHESGDRSDVIVERLEGGTEGLRRQMQDLSTTYNRAERGLEALGEALARRAQELSSTTDAALGKVGAWDKSVRSHVDALSTATSDVARKSQEINEVLDERTESVRAASNEATALLASLSERTEKTDLEEFTRQATFISERLQSLAVDISRVLETQVSEEDWRRFNKGEKGIFVRKLLGFREKAKLQQVRQTYQEDGTFRDYVTRYLEEFEKLLDEASKRDPNSMLHATFLSSDMGKVYMVLARALDRDM